MPEIKIEEKEIQKTIDNLLSMRAKEAAVTREAKKGDRCELDFETFIDNVAIEGGQAKKYSLELGKSQMIPGFEENLVGKKAGEDFEFDLRFPKDYHNKGVADKIAHFKIKMHTVFERTLPEVNDEFAKGLGFKSLEMFKKHLKTNIRQEKEQNEQAKKDKEIIDLIMSKSKFGDIPEALLNSEIDKMIMELKDNVSKQGLVFEDYLKHLKKSEAELKIDFAGDALKRIEAALIIRKIAENEKIEATAEEIDQEVERSIAMYKLQQVPEPELKKIEKQLRSEQYRDYVSSLLRNRKTIELLRAEIIKK